MEMKDLKAYAFDCISNIEHWQKQLQATHEAMRKAAQAPAKEEKPKITKPKKKK